jgi:hypothetical protein
VFWFFFWKLFFFVLLSLLSLIHGGRGWTLVEAWGSSSSILMWIHRILGLPIQQHRFSRLGSSLPVGFFGGRRAGLGTWSVPRSDEVVLELHLVDGGLQSRRLDPTHVHVADSACICHEPLRD